MSPLAALTLLLRLLVADPSALAPTIKADLDGDGREETVVATGKRGVVRVQVLDSTGRKAAEARAPSPDAEVVSIALTSAPLGSVGALVEVAATTDASACRSIWRYRGGELARLPLRDRTGKPLPDCEPAGRWTTRWERESEDRPAAYVRERVENTDRGTFRKREVYAFAGFSLDWDPKRSANEIAGVPVPSWYHAVLYTRSALDTLYTRFGLDALEREPTLVIETDPERGKFALRFSGPDGEMALPVDTFSLAGEATATIGAGDGAHRAYATVRLGGDGSVPVEVRVQGLGGVLDSVYAPAGGWHGGARQVFPSAADEIAAENLAGSWIDARGRNVAIALEGLAPYRLRIGADVFSVDMKGAGAAADLLLVGADHSPRAWGVSLRGPNSFVRTPMACSGEAVARVCRVDGEPDTLRRLGARVNAK